MAEEAKKKEEKPAAAAAPPGHGDKKEDGKAKGGGLFTKLPVLLGGVMVIEAFVLFAGFKIMGGGAKPAAAATDLTEAGAKGEAAKGEGEGGKDGAAAAPDPKK